MPNASAPARARVKSWFRMGLNILRLFLDRPVKKVDGERMGGDECCNEPGPETKKRATSFSSGEASRSWRPLDPEPGLGGMFSLGLL